MKKLFKNAIFSVFFTLCCIFAFFCINSLSVKINAIENENQEQEEITECQHQEEVIDGIEATCTTTGLTFGVKCSLCGVMLQEQEIIPALEHQYTEWEIVIEATETEKGIKKQICILCNFENVVEFELEKTEEKPPLEDLPQIDDEQIEETFSEIKDWIVALVVSFLGSSGFMAIVKIIIDKWSKKKQEELQIKLDEMEQEKQIATEEKDLMIKQFNELSNQFKEVLEHNVILCDYIKTKIEVDEEKVYKTNKLLESLLPKENEETNNEK